MGAPLASRYTLVDLKPCTAVFSASASSLTSSALRVGRQRARSAAEIIRGTLLVLRRRLRDDFAPLAHAPHPLRSGIHDDERLVLVGVVEVGDVAVLVEHRD